MPPLTTTLPELSSSSCFFWLCVLLNSTRQPFLIELPIHKNLLSSYCLQRPWRYRDFWHGDPLCNQSSVRRNKTWAPLEAQWWRICLPLQETWVWSLIWKDHTCLGATKPVCHSYWTCAPALKSHSYWAHRPQLMSPQAATLKPAHPRSRAPQEEPPQWEACTLQLESRPHLPQLEGIPSSNKHSAQPKINLKKNNFS